MKAGMASVPDRVLRIVVVTGSLALLPGLAFGTPAHASPSDDGTSADSSAPAAFDSAVCSSAEVPTGLLQLPPEDPGVPMCPDEKGEERPCDPDELFKMCVSESERAYEVCRKDAGFWRRQGCRVLRAERYLECTIEGVKDYLGL